jgi:hypothetical protein
MRRLRPAQGPLIEAIAIPIRNIVKTIFSK